MEAPLIVGILNVTPDSYVERGAFAAPDAALRRAEELLRDGADILEIGGESTGPGSPEVSEAEELRRVLPVIEAVRERFPDARMSVDTWKAAVARAALERGAVMINDVTAGRGDAGLFAAAAGSAALLVLMYSKDPTPRTAIAAPPYGDPVLAIRAFLEARLAAAVAAGIPKNRIVLDPGLGHFVSSDPAVSFAVIARLPEIAALGCALFLSPSRKSFLAWPEELPVAERLPGTVAASAIAVFRGAAYIRTHDVQAVRRGCLIASAIRSARS